MSKLTYIVLVEDDYNQQERNVAELKNKFPSAKVECICCEAEFLDRFEKPPKNLPDVFIIDMMLEWRFPFVQTKRNLPRPAPFEEEAGLRCLEVIRKYAVEVPVILWTITNMAVTSEQIRQPATFYLRKDWALEGDLFSLIEKATKKAGAK